MAAPNLSEFDPFKIKWQGEAIQLLRRDFDYSLGTLELLLSGSVGSAKSIWMAHAACTHCLLYPGADLLIGRMGMPHLKSTILQMIIEHLDECVEFEHNKTTGQIYFPHNGSRMTPISWQDGKFKKFRSYTPSAAIIEELTENQTDDAYKELRMRLGRRPDIPESFLIMATNPDSPSHWAHKQIIEKQSNTKKVMYSITEHNPFLPKNYIENLKDTLSDKECRRMIYGEWIDLSQDVIYWNYLKERNYKDYDYQFKMHLPVDLCFDFNIGLGKPMSAGTGQFDTQYHCAKDYVVHGARTLDILEEMNGDGIFDKGFHFRIFGDATGSHRDTRSNRSDYDIITDYLNKHPKMPSFEMCVGRSNPAIRSRHNRANALFENANKKSMVNVYKGAEVTDEGFRLSKLKKNGNYIEDDSDEFQHITTARTYWFYENEEMRNQPKVRIRRRG